MRGVATRIRARAGTEGQHVFVAACVRSHHGAAAAARDIDDPGQARERAALAWTRSALTMVASGAVIARAAFVGHVAWLTVFSAVAIATLSVLTWHHGQVICREHREPGIPQNL